MSTTDVALESTGTSLATAQAAVVTATPGASSPTVISAGATAGIPWRVVLKRALDVTLSLFGLIVLAPLFLAIAMAIKLTDPGPVFYRHRRLTLGGTPLEIYKFRTMYARYCTGERFGGRTDADVFAELGHPELTDEFRQRQKLRDDPRISRLGAWLRRTSLDELPQLWNILLGDLSTVGPRPIVHAELSWYDGVGDHLLSAKPGLTGLWQVSGRSELSYEDRVRLDMEYARSLSLMLDLKIVCRTLPAILSGRGAY